MQSLFYLVGPVHIGGNVDSARQNLASSFVNGFVNAAFGKDKLLFEEGNKWLYKNKEHGMMSATATLGLVLLWDVDSGLTQIDKYLYSSEDYIKVGFHVTSSHVSIVLVFCDVFIEYLLWCFRQVLFSRAVSSAVV